MGLLREAGGCSTINPAPVATVSLGTCAQTVLIITQPVRSGTITWTKRTIDPVNTASVIAP
jgi:hypothetical protein